MVRQLERCAATLIELLQRWLPFGQRLQPLGQIFRHAAMPPNTDERAPESRIIASLSLDAREVGRAIPDDEILEGTGGNGGDHVVAVGPPQHLEDERPRPFRIVLDPLPDGFEVIQRTSDMPASSIWIESPRLSTK